MLKNSVVFMAQINLFTDAISICHYNLYGAEVMLEQIVRCIYTWAITAFNILLPKKYSTFIQYFWLKSW